MAIVQISKIQVRTGAESDLPQLDIGELGFATDTKTLYVGNDPLLDPPIGTEPTLTQLLTNSPNCFINASQITGVLNIKSSDIKIAGGRNGFVLQTDGTGNVSWAASSGGGGGGGSVGDSTHTQIQFNDEGVSNGSSNLTFTKDNSTLILIGNLEATNITGVITVSASSQPNITSLGNLVVANVTGNLKSGNANLGNLTTSNYFSGNGSLLTSVVASTAATVTASSQPNITSIGTLTSLSVTGLTTLSDVSNIRIGGGTAGQLLRTDGLGNVTWVSGGGGTSTYGNLDVQTFMNANYIPNFTGIVPKATVAYNIDGANVIGQVANANIATTAINAGTVTVAAQPNITSVGTLVSLDVTGDINSGNLIATGTISGTYVSGNGSRLTSITGANINGLVANATYATSAGTAGIATIANVANNAITSSTADTVLSPAQPNITSVGTLTLLSVTGNITGGNILTDGRVVPFGIENTNWGWTSVVTSSTSYQLNSNLGTAKRVYVFTGSSNQNIGMPLTNFNTLVPEYYFINNSTGTLFIQDAVGFDIVTVPPGGDVTVTGTFTSTPGASYWHASSGAANVLTVATAPSSSKGATGDIKGRIAFDDSYIYYCRANYVDGSTDIWSRVAMSQTTF